MSSQRPLYIRQSEAGPNADNLGDYWFTVAAGNAETVLTSKMYRERWRAIRAARAFIKSIGDTPVTFSYWAGTTPVQGAEAAALGRAPRGSIRHVVERINQDDNLIEQVA